MAPTAKVYVLMEVAGDTDLSSLMAEETPLPKLASIMAQAAQATFALHAAGMVHMDIKPRACPTRRRRGPLPT